MGDQAARQGWQALDRGALGEAAAAFARAIGGDPQPLNPWVGLVTCHLLAGQAPEIARLLDIRHQAAADGPELLRSALHLLADNGQIDVLEAFGAAQVPRSPRRALAAYHQAVALMQGQRLDPALPLLLEARAGFEADPDRALYQDNPSFKGIYHHTVNVESDDVVAAAWGQRRQAPPPVRFHGDRAAARGTVLLVGCDPGYFRLFAARFAAAARPHLAAVTLHFHLVDADADCLAEAAALAAAEAPAGVDLRFSDGPSGHLPADLATFAACVRFFIAAQVLEQYRRPLVAADIDMLARRDLSPLWRAAAAADFCCHVRPAMGPGGYAYAAVTSFSPGLGAEFAELVRQYCEGRIRQDPAHAWFIDQVALFRCAQWAGRHLPGFRQGDLTQAAGPFADFFEHLSEDEKKALRQRNMARRPGAA